MNKKIWNLQVLIFINDKDKYSERLNAASKIRELKIKLIEVEDLLNRKQKDKLYLIFKQAEGIARSDFEIVNLLENMLKEIRES